MGKTMVSYDTIRNSFGHSPVNTAQPTLFRVNFPVKVKLGLEIPGVSHDSYKSALVQNLTLHQALVKSIL